MKRNYIPPGRIYSEEEISALNRRLDQLCAALQPEAERVFKRAMRRRTASSGAEVLTEETSASLCAILAELGEEPAFQRELALLREQLTLELQRAPAFDELADAEWLKVRSQDLARAFVNFWMDFAASDELRRHFSRGFLRQAENQRPSEYQRHMELICSRYFLEPEDARALLEALNDAASGVTSGWTGASHAERQNEQSGPLPHRQAELGTTDLGRREWPGPSTRH
ncbi:hypothetical protein [Pseudoduganella namucuonensis]|uniref:Uncharacterized protein n=1 Tax=Pseudoduganella namucuonensis TaxID=1035707 RepID=A0A1I7M2T4_9BURK|nr:hypothetical protein [Pseudoduganella namucuonensis]SFV16282.1 hypothetical protein SAMN05216552_10515 [Pseudoduganella namucuonensis]